MEDKLPDNALELIMSSGIFGWAIILLAVVLCVGWLIMAVAAKSRRGPMVLFGFSFMPLCLGMLGTGCGTISMCKALVMNPDATFSDFAAGAYIASTTLIMGGLVSLLMVPAYAILLAIKDKPCVAKGNESI